MILLVEVINVDVVGPQPAQAGLGRLHDPLPREAPPVRPWTHGIGNLGSQDPCVPLGRYGAAGHFLGSSFVVCIGRIDEINPGVARAVDDAFGGRLIRLPPEHHRAEADGRNFQARPAEIRILHYSPWCSVGRQPQCLGCLQINDQLEMSWLLDGSFACRRALKDPVEVSGRLKQVTENLRTVAHQNAGAREIRVRSDCRHVFRQSYL